MCVGLIVIVRARHCQMIASVVVSVCEGYCHVTDECVNAWEHVRVCVRMVCARACACVGTDEMYG